MIIDDFDKMFAERIKELIFMVVQYHKFHSEETKDSLNKTVEKVIRFVEDELEN